MKPIKIVEIGGEGGKGYSNRVRGRIPIWEDDISSISPADKSRDFLDSRRTPTKRRSSYPR